MSESSTGLEQEACTNCGSIYDPEDEGCSHDGRRLCRDCMDACPECRADLIADHLMEIAD